MHDLIPDVSSAEFPPYDLFPQCPDWVHASGVLSSAKSASAEKGELMARHIANGISAATRQEFQGKSLVPINDGVAQNCMA